MSTILVVDDEAGIRRALHRLLAARGHSVVEAATAADGIAAVRAGGIDAVVCDVVMPGESGFVCYDQIVAIDPKMAKRVVFLTAAAQEPEVQARTEALGVPLISKLYQLELAVDAIGVALLRKA